MFGIRQVENRRLPGPGIVACNAEDRDGLARLFDRHQFAAVLDLRRQLRAEAVRVGPGAGLEDQRRGRAESAVADRAPRGIRLVHLSLRPGLLRQRRPRAATSKTDPTDPVTVYGKTMVAGEQAMLAERPGGLHPADLAADGRSFNGHAGAIDWITVAVQEVAAGNALLRRDPHADLHRLHEPAL